MRPSKLKCYYLYLVSTLYQVIIRIMNIIISENTCDSIGLIPPFIFFYFLDQEIIPNKKVKKLNILNMI
jgi:hypothetical protein